MTTEHEATRTQGAPPPPPPPPPPPAPGVSVAPPPPPRAAAPAPPPPDAPRSDSSDADRAVLRWVVPVDRSGWAIAAGYLGLLSVLGVFAPFAVGAGVLALRDLRRRPDKRGRGRAWFGIVVGGICSVLLAIGLATG